MRSDLLAASRWAIWAPASAGILLVALGIALAYTSAFPDVRCSGDVCLMTSNAFTIPAILIGTTLGIASVVLFALQRTHRPPAAKH